jgi:hypothetical protein
MLYQKDIKKWSDDPILAAKEMMKIILKDIGLTENLNIEKTSLPIFHPKKQANLLYE